ncbi:SDR family oxidoreductase [Motilimonas pumila]|uniref:SDR family NAD(P)-dependent oxidoreductase n=1 Tax=Motilimonas pumila TaxID=2303987 RepID=A0A418Y9V1_9GAMM|nr:SDR family NAD(P)-dependent oxidoreductase [Motilimonas pumila]RJG38281.1 SDR family NAD(P)-dependent oxidoreductase [Motilimonas pumila]
MKLKQKTIAITGATSGIGLALVEQLYEHNQLIIIARNQHKINQLSDKYPNLICIQADLTNQQQIQHAAEILLTRCQQLDVLINNAAVQHCHYFTDKQFSPASIDQEISLNFSAVCHLTYLCLPLLKQSSQGTILNINSGLGLVPKTASAVYCATKAALNHFSISLGEQLKPYNISVCQAFLPLVDTAMTQGRGTHKLTATQASLAIINGIKQQQVQCDIGKVRWLRLLQRLMPSAALSLMRKY